MKKSNVLNKKSMRFLETYLNNPSPTGYEWEGQKIWMDYLKPYVDAFITDTYGTAVGVINPDAPFKVVIEAHSDEISWYVNYITENGLIHVIRNGGSDHMIAPSKWVNIHTKKGIVKGVFGWPLSIPVWLVKRIHPSSKISRLISERKTKKKSKKWAYTLDV